LSHTKIVWTISATDNNHDLLSYSLKLLNIFLLIIFIFLLLFIRKYLTEFYFLCT